MSNGYQLPMEGLIRLDTVLKVIPVSPSTWYRGVQEGRYPKPIKIGKRNTAYNVQDIRKLINQPQP